MVRGLDDQGRLLGEDLFRKLIQVPFRTEGVESLAQILDTRVSTPCVLIKNTGLR